jgi:hypothetical protein
MGSIHRQHVKQRVVRHSGDTEGLIHIGLIPLYICGEVEFS